MTAPSPKPAACVPTCPPKATKAGSEGAVPTGADTGADSAAVLLSRIARITRALAEAVEDLAKLGQIQLAGSGGTSVMDGDVQPNSDANTDSAPGLLTANDLARLFQVDRKTIRRWKDEGRLPEPVQIGGVVRWHAGELDAWLRGGAR